MSYINGNDSADYLYRQKVVGKKCDMCRGTGKIQIANWTEFKNLLRNFEFSFQQLLAIAREWRKGGYDKIDCPECNGEGVL